MNKTQLRANILAFGLCGTDFGICVLLASKIENNQLEERQSFRCLCSTGNKPFNRNPPLSNLRMDYCQKVFSVQKEVEGKANASCLERVLKYRYLALCMQQEVEAGGVGESRVGV